MARGMQNMRKESTIIMEHMLKDTMGVAGKAGMRMQPLLLQEQQLPS